MKRLLQIRRHLGIESILALGILASCSGGEFSGQGFLISKDGESTSQTAPKEETAEPEVNLNIEDETSHSPAIVAGTHLLCEIKAVDTATAMTTVYCRAVNEQGDLLTLDDTQKIEWLIKSLDGLPLDYILDYPADYSDAEVDILIGTEDQSRIYVDTIIGKNLPENSELAITPSSQSYYNLTEFWFTDSNVFKLPKYVPVPEERLMGITVTLKVSETSTIAICTDTGGTITSFSSRDLLNFSMKEFTESIYFDIDHLSGPEAIQPNIADINAIACTSPLLTGYSAEDPSRSAIDYGYDFETSIKTLDDSEIIWTLNADQLIEYTGKAEDTFDINVNGFSNSPSLGILNPHIS